MLYHNSYRPRPSGKTRFNAKTIRTELNSIDRRKQDAYQRRMYHFPRWSFVKKTKKLSPGTRPQFRGRVKLFKKPFEEIQPVFVFRDGRPISVKNSSARNTYLTSGLKNPGPNTEITLVYWNKIHFQ